MRNVPKCQRYGRALSIADLICNAVAKPFILGVVDSALLDRTPHGLTTYEAAQQAYETWSAQCEQQSVLPFQALTGERPPKQHKITALVHQKKVQEVAPGSARTRIMRSSMKLREAKTWANWIPSTAYATYIPHHHFKVWLQYYCRVPLFQPGTRCQRPQCAAFMDTYGDHLLYCERVPHRIWRHDAHVKLLARELAKAARHLVVEERPLGSHRERPDLRAFWRSGGTELFGVTICHPLSQAQIRDVVERRQWPEQVSPCYLFLWRHSVVGTRTLIRRYALSQVPLPHGDCPHSLALGASCPGATRLYL